MSIFSAISGIFGGKQKHHVYYTYENDLPSDEIEENRERIVALLKGTKRPGMDRVLQYMEKHDFYNMPSSIHHHHNYRGGLAEHVLSVYGLTKKYAPELPDDSLIIVSILHDLCKADNWHYDKKGGLHRNHGIDHHRGRKSIKILKECGLQLTESERLAIRWHMGGHNAKESELADSTKAREDALWKVLFKANKENSNR